MNATKEQREFIDAVLEMIKMSGLSPKIMNGRRNNPLGQSRKSLKNAKGLW
jgi:hypothetical protein